MNFAATHVEGNGTAEVAFVDGHVRITADGPGCYAFGAVESGLNYELPLEVRARWYAPTPLPLSSPPPATLVIDDVIERILLCGNVPVVMSHVDNIGTMCLTSRREFEEQLPCVRVPLKVTVDGATCRVERGRFELPRATQETQLFRSHAIVRYGDVVLRTGADEMTMWNDGKEHTSDFESTGGDVFLLNAGMEPVMCNNGFMNGGIFVEWFQRDLTLLSTPLEGAAHTWHLRGATSSCVVEHVTL